MFLHPSVQVLGPAKGHPLPLPPSRRTSVAQATHPPAPLSNHRRRFSSSGIDEGPSRYCYERTGGPDVQTNAFPEPDDPNVKFYDKCAELGPHEHAWPRLAVPACGSECAQFIDAARLCVKAEIGRAAMRNGRDSSCSPGPCLCGRPDEGDRKEIPFKEWFGAVANRAWDAWATQARHPPQQTRTLLETLSLPAAATLPSTRRLSRASHPRSRARRTSRSRSPTARRAAPSRAPASARAAPTRKRPRFSRETRPRSACACSAERGTTARSQSPRRASTHAATAGGASKGARRRRRTRGYPKHIDRVGPLTRMHTAES